MMENASLFFFLSKKNQIEQKDDDDINNNINTISKLIGNIGSKQCKPNQSVNKKQKKHKKRKSFHLNMEIPPIQTDMNNLDCSLKRTVFLDLFEFYKCWRLISSDVLFDAIIIVPNCYIQWILNPHKFIHEIPTKMENILFDDVFNKLLQWKYQQNLLFCMLNNDNNNNNNNNNNNDIAPFWYELNDILSELDDPLTYKTSNYSSIIFDDKYYISNKYKSKYNIKPVDIISELQSMDKHQKNINVICEILYQSNPSLNVIINSSSTLDSGNRSNTTKSILSADVLDELSSECVDALFSDSKSDPDDDDIDKNDKQPSITPPPPPPQQQQQQQQQQNNKEENKECESDLDIDQVLDSIIDDWYDTDNDNNNDDDDDVINNMINSNATIVSGHSTESFNNRPSRSVNTVLTPLHDAYKTNNSYYMITPSPIIVIESDDDDDKNQDVLTTNMDVDHKLDGKHKQFNSYNSVKRDSVLINGGNWWIADDYYENDK